MPAADPQRLLQAARACLRRGRTRDAATLMALACEVAPLDVRCHALHAWLQVQCGEARATVVGQQLVELLSRAVRLYPSDLELRMHRAAVLQRLGRPQEALVDFSFVANEDPCNAEATEEVRRHDQRAALASSGVFARDGSALTRGESKPKTSDTGATPTSEPCRVRTNQS